MLFSTTATGRQVDHLDGTLTLAKLLETQQTLRDMCPFYQIMREHDKRPEEGWVLVLPITLRTADHPSYVRYSPIIDQQTMVFINEKEMFQYASRP